MLFAARSEGGYDRMVAKPYRERVEQDSQICRVNTERGQGSTGRNTRSPQSNVSCRPGALTATSTPSPSVSRMTSDMMSAHTPGHFDAHGYTLHGDDCRNAVRGRERRVHTGWGNFVRTARFSPQ